MIVDIAIPEITIDPKTFLPHWVNAIVRGNRPVDHRVYAIVTTYVRLVEGALVHYALARQQTNTFWNAHTAFAIGSVNLSSTYFEDCITSMHRATLCMTRIRSSREVPSELKALFPTKPRFAKGAAKNKLRDLRDAIQHMDEMIFKGEIPANTPFQIQASGPETPIPDQPGQTLLTIDRLIIGNQQVLISEMVEWLTEMADCAVVIAKYRRSDESKPRTFLPIALQ